MSEFPIGIYSENESIIGERARVGDAFRCYYEERGFSATDEIPPYPSPDATVKFIGAQISVWKPLIDDIAHGNHPPLITPQDCIRLQNKDIFYTEDDLRFCSYFRTQGAITKASDFNDTVNGAIDFLELLGVSRDRIVVKTSQEQTRLFYTDIQRLIETEDRSYYSWTYGEDDLVGQGITIAINNIHTNVPHDIGNVILVSRGDEPLVTEWGFGEETLMSAIYSNGPPIIYSNLPSEFIKRLNSQDMYKYADALVAAVTMANLGVALDTRGEGAMLDEYVCATAYLGLKNKVSYWGILEDFKNITVHTGATIEANSDVAHKLEYYIGRVSYSSKLIDEGSPIEYIYDSLHISKAMLERLKKGSQK
ncbi:hypothetical protein H6796_02775 [Candidatus Nomurabacteria bacterium]|nr:hypothetical protein [Candidatus Nomurabacteria bacterium]